MRAGASNPILIFDICLAGSRPRIWRRFTAPSSLTLANLHRLIQAVMGWENRTLYEFRIGRRVFGPRDPYEPFWDMASDILDDNSYSLKDLRLARGSKLKYIYSYRELWEHSVQIREVCAPDDSIPEAQCLAGARACPPERSGGLAGYEAQLSILEDPTHPEHATARRRLGIRFDPKEFDLKRMNRRIRALRLTQEHKLWGTPSAT